MAEIKRKFVFRNFKKIAKLFIKKVNIINFNDMLEDRAIYVANHSGASGPLNYELYFPKTLTPWGTHEMTENYKSRWNYLYHTFYRQKLRYKKFKSFCLATSFGLISKMLYNGTGLIPTYQDARLVGTFKKSFQVLNSNNALLIFPENSNEGYKEILEEYNFGFIELAKLYYKKYKFDVPVYNIYFSKRHKTMVVDKPVFINKLLESGKTFKEIAQQFVQRANQMFIQNIISKNFAQ